MSILPRSQVMHLPINSLLYDYYKSIFENGFNNRKCQAGVVHECQFMGKLFVNLPLVESSKLALALVLFNSNENIFRLQKQEVEIL